jgi:hypothetical protein
MHKITKKNPARRVKREITRASAAGAYRELIAKFV